jgi:FkbM family methyltransferase
VADPQSPRPERPLEYHETATGNYYLPSDTPGDVIIQAITAGKVFEPHVVEAARQFIRPGTVALDVGACFGQMSILFSGLVGEDGEVMAFEADDYLFGILQKNIEANGRRNIRALCRAVYDTSGVKKFYPVPDFTRFASYGSYGLDPRATSGREVETITIDSLKIEKPVSFFKVDVQGSDLFVLRGAVETIARHKMPIIFEFEDQFQDEFETSFADYGAFIDSISYRVHQVVDRINYLIVPRDMRVPGFLSRLVEKLTGKVLRRG